MRRRILRLTLSCCVSQIQTQFVNVREGQQGALNEMTAGQINWQEQLDELERRIAEAGLLQTHGTQPQPQQATAVIADLQRAVARLEEQGSQPTTPAGGNSVVELTKLQVQAITHSWLAGWLAGCASVAFSVCLQSV